MSVPWSQHAQCLGLDPDR